MAHYRSGIVFRIMVLACALVLSACSGAHPFHSIILDPPNPAPDFTLTAHTGQPFRLSEQRGKLVLLFFGYTSCPDICPTGLADLAAMRRELGTDADQVQVVFISVDPDRDTIERLRGYVTGFDPTFIGLRGTQAELDPVLKAYSVTAVRREFPNSAIKYTFDHSTYTYAIDKSGRWRAILPYGLPVIDLASDVRYLARDTGGT